MYTKFKYEMLQEEIKENSATEVPSASIGQILGGEQSGFYSANAFRK